METSILWNGFEIKKGQISTSVGYVPYIFYNPEMSTEAINIAIHGEGNKKEDWLCFNCSLKLGNLLKESIRHNSPFIAFDLYGHGEWIIENKNFNTTHLSDHDQNDLIEKSTRGIQEAIEIITDKEELKTNPISLTSTSLGCSVALGINLKLESYKSILISPLKSPVKSNCQNYFILRSKDDTLIDGLPDNTIVETFDSHHEIPVSWINKVKDFIYS